VRPPQNVQPLNCAGYFGPIEYVSGANANKIIVQQCGMQLMFYDEKSNAVAIGVQAAACCVRFVAQ